MTFEEKISIIDHIFSGQKHQIKGPSGLKKILEQFTFNAEEMQEHLLNPEDLPYGRKCVFRSAAFIP